MGVRRATAADVPSWMRLAAEVEPLFGPMPGLQAVIERNVRRGTALVLGREGEVRGGMLLSGGGRPHRIAWLAVSPAARGQGVGRALVGAALRAWPDGGIEVVTFADGTPGAGPASAFYRAMGFERVGPEPVGPGEGRRDRYRLSRPSC